MKATLVGGSTGRWLAEAAAEAVTRGSTTWATGKMPAGTLFLNG